MKKLLVLIRGVSGSGKTTFANMLKSQSEKVNICCKIFEADDYFMKNGHYRFNPSELPFAHKQCFENTEKALKDDETNIVVVSNTFVRKWEIEPYIELANNDDVDLKIYRMNTQFENTHDVPKSKVEKMKRSMESIENEIIVDTENNHVKK